MVNVPSVLGIRQKRLIAHPSQKKTCYGHCLNAPLMVMQSEVVDACHWLDAALSCSPLVISLLIRQIAKSASNKPKDNEYLLNARYSTEILQRHHLF